MGNIKTSTAVKRAQGTLRKDRDIPPLSMEPLSALPDVPTKIENNVDASDYWEMTCGLLLSRGMLYADHLNSIMRASFLFSQYCEAMKEIQDGGSVEVSKTGWKQIGAWFSIAEKCEKMLIAFEDRYGLNLVASQKIQAPVRDKKEDDFD